MKHDEIIAKFGGPRPLATALGHSHPTTVYEWARNKAIPKWRWHEVLKAARKLRLGIKEADFNGAAK